MGFYGDFQLAKQQLLKPNRKKELTEPHLICVTDQPVNPAALFYNFEAVAWRVARSISTLGINYLFFSSMFVMKLILSLSLFRLVLEIYNVLFSSYVLRRGQMSTKNKDDTYFIKHKWINMKIILSLNVQNNKRWWPTFDWMVFSGEVINIIYCTVSLNKY